MFRWAFQRWGRLVPAWPGGGVNAVDVEVLATAAERPNALTVWDWKAVR